MKQFTCPLCGRHELVHIIEGSEEVTKYDEYNMPVYSDDYNKICQEDYFRCPYCGKEFEDDTDISGFVEEII